MATVEIQIDGFMPRNQSKLHCELANRSLRWASARCTGRGVRGGTEVPLADGYVCDAAAILGFQRRFLNQYLRHAGLKERIYFAGEWRDGDVLNEFACIFEAKVSRADFLGTFGNGARHANRHTPVGSLHWCVTPKGLIKPHELPPFWGLLEAAGRGLTESKLPTINPTDANRLNRLAYQILWYGHWNARWREIGTCPECLKDYQPTT